MIKEEYSPYKLVHFPRALRDMRLGRLPAPLQAHLIATNRCNQDCDICAYRRDGHQSNQRFDPRDQLPGEKLMEIINDLAALGCKAVQFTGGGEPLLHQDITRAFKRARKLGMSIALVTNGTRLGPEAIEALEGAAWVRVSLDAATPETYAKAKNSPAKNFDLVVENIRRLVEFKGDTVVGIGFVVQRHNHGEILATAKLAKSLGVDNIRLAAAFTPEGTDYFRDFLDDAMVQAKGAADLSDDGFTVFNLFNERLGELFSGRQRYPYCHYKDLVPYIGANQVVYSCCVKAYTDHGAMGSIANRRMVDFWSDHLRAKTYGKHDPQGMCQHPCMFEEKNKFINYCVKPRPRHAGFI